MNLEAPKWKESLERDGFIHQSGFFSASEVEELRERIESYICNAVPALPREHYSLEGDRETVRSLSFVHRHDSFFGSFTQTGRCMKAVSRYFNDACECLQMQYFAKAPRVGGPAPWHQDNAYRFFEPPESMVFWIPLDPATKENGCLHYARGSHRAGLLPHVFSNLDGFSQGMEAPPPADFPVVAVEADPGDCLIHLGNTAHCSGENQSAAPRRALQVLYRSLRAVPDPGRVARYQEQVRALKASM